MGLHLVQNRGVVLTPHRHRSETRRAQSSPPSSRRSRPDHAGFQLLDRRLPWRLQGALQVARSAYYQAIGVPREAYDKRRDASLCNLEFFNAPQVALLFMPVMGDSVRAAGDVGMYAQTFLLSLTAHGLGGIPQTMLGFYAETIRQEIGIDPSLKMLFGISFGFTDQTSPANSYRIEKAPLDETMTFHH
ncbi:nitroreductase family protein [Methylobacterium sp.]|uniref:nitroreductase family protein n=1 Tax=Methylobacterium sp. TaxID=409 RepID=UPI003B0048F2